MGDPNGFSEHEAFVDEVNDALSRVANSESIVLLGDFNATLEQTMKHGRV